MGFSSSNFGKVAGVNGLASGLDVALQQRALIKPPGNGKGGIVMTDYEEEEVIEHHGRVGKTGHHRGGMVMEGVPEEEEPIQTRSLLGKLAYQVCEDDIQRLKSNRAVSMVSQNILASSLGTGFAGKNQNLLAKQSIKAR